MILVKFEKVLFKLTETFALVCKVFEESSMCTFDILRNLSQLYWPSREALFVNLVEVPDIVLVLKVLLVVSLQIVSRLTQWVKCVFDCFDCVCCIAKILCKPLELLMKIDVSFFGLVWSWAYFGLESFPDFLYIWNVETDTSVLCDDVVNTHDFHNLLHGSNIIIVLLAVSLCQETHQIGVTAQDSVSQNIT